VRLIRPRIDDFPASRKTGSYSGLFLETAVRRPEATWFENLDAWRRLIRSLHLLASTHCGSSRTTNRIRPGHSIHHKLCAFGCVLSDELSGPSVVMETPGSSTHHIGVSLDPSVGLRMPLSWSIEPDRYASTRVAARSGAAGGNDAVVEQAHAPDAASGAQVKVEISARVSETLFLLERC
jgi:hypothetical protein